MKTHIITDRFGEWLNIMRHPVRLFRNFPDLVYGSAKKDQWWNEDPQRLLNWAKRHFPDDADIHNLMEQRVKQKRWEADRD